MDNFEPLGLPEPREPVDCPIQPVELGSEHRDPANKGLCFPWPTVSGFRLTISRNALASAIGSVLGSTYLALGNHQTSQGRFAVRSNGASEQGGRRVVGSLRAKQDMGGLHVVPEPRAPQEDLDQDTVVSIVGHSLGPVLDDLAEAKQGIRKAQQFRKTAKTVGAHEVETMIARELQGLEAAARIDS